MSDDLRYGIAIAIKKQWTPGFVQPDKVRKPALHLSDIVRKRMHSIVGAS
jgi:hypothetical protein